MTEWLCLEDTSYPLARLAGGSVAGIRAGVVVDDLVYDVPAARAAGVALIRTSPAVLAARTAFLTRPLTPDYSTGGDLASLLLAGVIAPAGAIGYAAAIYVDAARGDDATAQRGNAGAPYATLQAAASAMLEGDAILVGPGDYAGATIPALLRRWAIVGVGGPDVTRTGGLLWAPAQTSGSQTGRIADLEIIGASARALDVQGATSLAVTGLVVTGCRLGRVGTPGPVARYQRVDSVDVASQTAGLSELVNVGEATLSGRYADIAVSYDEAAPQPQGGRTGAVVIAADCQGLVLSGHPAVRLVPGILVLGPVSAPALTEGATLAPDLVIVGAVLLAGGTLAYPINTLGAANCVLRDAVIIGPPLAISQAGPSPNRLTVQLQQAQIEVSSPITLTGALDVDARGADYQTESLTFSAGPGVTLDRDVVSDIDTLTGAATPILFSIPWPSASVYTVQLTGQGLTPGILAFSAPTAAGYTIDSSTGVGTVFWVAVRRREQ